MGEEEAACMCLHDFDGDGEEEVACALPSGRLCILKARDGDQLEEISSTAMECEGMVVFLLVGRLLDEEVSNLIAIDMAGVAHIYSVHVHTSRRISTKRCFSHPLTKNICKATVMMVGETRSCILIATTDGKFQAYVPQEVQVKELVSRSAKLSSSALMTSMLEDNSRSPRSSDAKSAVHPSALQDFFSPASPASQSLPLLRPKASGISGQFRLHLYHSHQFQNGISSICPVGTNRDGHPVCAVSLITKVSPRVLVINGRHSLENMEDSNNNEAEIEHEWLKSQLNLCGSADQVKDNIVISMDAIEATGGEAEDEAAQPAKTDLGDTASSLSSVWLVAGVHCNGEIFVHKFQANSLPVGDANQTLDASSSTSLPGNEILSFKIDVKSRDDRPISIMWRRGPVLLDSCALLDQVVVFTQMGRVVFIDMEGHSILAEVGAPIAQASVRSSACNKRLFLAVLLLSGHVRFYTDIRLTSLKMRSLLHVRQQLSDLLDFSSSGSQDVEQEISAALYTDWNGRAMHEYKQWLQSSTARGER